MEGIAILDVDDFQETDGAFHFQVRRYNKPRDSPVGATDQVVSYKREHLLSSIRKIVDENPFESHVPKCYMDETITTLAEIFNGRGDSSNNQDLKALVTIFAMPGSGKSRSVSEAARAARAEHFRYRLNPIDDPKNSYHALLNDDDNTNVEEIVRGFVLKAIKQDTLPTFHDKTIHFDEVQVFLPCRDGQRKLQSLANGCNSIVYPPGRTPLSWLKFVFTGTSINARESIDLGSQSKAESVPITGSFPKWFVVELFNKHICEPIRATWTCLKGAATTVG